MLPTCRARTYERQSTPRNALQGRYCRYPFALTGECAHQGRVYARRPNMLLTPHPSRLAVYIALPAHGHARRPCRDVRTTNSNTVTSILTSAWRSLVYDRPRCRAPLRPTLVDELERVAGPSFPFRGHPSSVARYARACSITVPSLHVPRTARLRVWGVTPNTLRGG